MSAMSDYLEDALAGHLFHGTALTQPTLYVALFTDDPTDADTGTEATSGSYARKAHTAWTKASGVASNTTAVTFPVATGTWGTITHFGIYDAASGGNLLFHGALDESKTITNGETFQFDATYLSVTFA
jgi:hypothetical protein